VKAQCPAPPANPHGRRVLQLLLQNLAPGGNPGRHSSAASTRLPGAVKHTFTAKMSSGMITASVR